ncbi:MULTISPECIES: M20 family metallopeptidase [unclassified Fusibacter]|uniref:M20 metallopeptidase family protein n=1 Tax=unclassified Fusibacter TaxID=2624464 RepID=UPI0010134180|nr:MULTISPECIES: M20 family metallopeptidase [unclassified Fusibacter]MCK8058694.1 M20 family metallopeptidase [Fusibacter sp. A2]NPE21768.1 amidohydrolase [Fusibacter sp. A1]RXV61342.1 amidohydrolase [Fusibacter sp. A1]
MNELNKITTIRRELHKIPEIGFHELKTRALLTHYLEETGAQIHHGFCKTAVIAYFEFKKGAPTIAFRSDMDALSLSENTEHEYKSVHEGMMHACGHDGHMAMLLMLAYRLKDMKLKNYNVALVFQPAEEGPGGAEELVKTDLFKSLNITAMYGYHVYPELPAGTIGTSKGALMAATSEMKIEFCGVASHGAQPQLGKDSLVAAAEFLLSAQSIISRSVNPLDPAILTFGTFSGGERLNIIARNAVLEGTMRTYSDEVHRLIKTQVELRAKHIAAAHGMSANVEFRDMYPALINDRTLAEEVIGHFEHIIEIEPVMLAEDFSYYGKVVPSLFMFLGIRTESNGTHPLHSDKFDFDEQVLLVGVDTYESLLLFKDKQFKLDK